MDPGGWLGMAPRDSTVTDPVRPCLVRRSQEVGQWSDSADHLATTANPSPRVGQGVGGRQSG